jgi:hypothetical protein
MLSLKLVKGKKAGDQEDTDALVDGLPHGTKVMLELLKHWVNKPGPPRIVCADSYFASVPAVSALRDRNLLFIGVIKTATKQYPMPFFNNHELSFRGQHKHLVSVKEDGEVEMIALVWLDRNRRHFIGNAEGATVVEPIFRIRWTQVVNNDYEEPERLELEIPQTAMTKTYYDVCGAIDQINRQRQDDLEFEHWLRFKTWNKRVGSSIHGMVIVDALNFQQIMAGEGCDEDPDTWYCTLAEQLIENNVDEVASGMITRSMQHDRPVARVENSAAAAVPLPVPSQKKKRSADGELTNRVSQRQCNICKTKCTNTCSICSQERMPNGSYSYEAFHICPPGKGDCWVSHVRNMHPH